MRGRFVSLFLGAVGILCPATGTGSEVAFTRIDLRTQEDHSWRDVRVGELNNDQQLDIQAGMQWFEGPTRVRHSIGPNPANIYGTGTSILHDLDHDGDLDIMTYIAEPYRYVWYENPGPSATGEWDLHVIRPIPAGWPECKLIVDIDGNGKDDLITLEKDGSGIQVAQIPDDPKSAQAWHFTQISSVWGHGLGLGDLNEDGLLDLVADYQWIEQNADGSWTDHVIP